MTARQRAAVLAISVRVLMRANPWNFSVFWSTESELPWNSRACETINAGAWATELLPCECVMRPITWLCVAPMEFGFDPLLSRSEPRSLIGMITASVVRAAWRHLVIVEGPENLYRIT